MVPQIQFKKRNLLHVIQTSQASQFVAMFNFDFLIPVALSYHFPVPFTPVGPHSLLKSASLRPGGYLFMHLTSNF